VQPSTAVAWGLGMRPNSLPTAHIDGARRSLPILEVGSCEPLKAVIHGVALSLAAVMGAYNAAAWLRRRQPHLAFNAVIYFAAVYWEQRHVAHHLVRCAPPQAPPQIGPEHEAAAERKAA